MGLFDYVRCAAFLDDRVGPQDVFQCKDLICCMGFYWIDPAGHLWRIDESATYDLIEESETALLAARDRNEWLPPFHPVPNGSRGRVLPHPLTGTIRIHPSDWRSKCKDQLTYSDWPKYELVFRNGKLTYLQCLK